MKFNSIKVSVNKKIEKIKTIVVDIDLEKQFNKIVKEQLADENVILLIE
jgi:hypothetical protein